MMLANDILQMVSDKRAEWEQIRYARIPVVMGNEPVYNALVTLEREIRSLINGMEWRVIEDG